jgi:hypothetical protein
LGDSNAIDVTLHGNDYIDGGDGNDYIAGQGATTTSSAVRGMIRSMITSFVLERKQNMEKSSDGSHGMKI